MTRLIGAYDLLPEWDYLALAKAFRADGFRVKTTMELHDLLGQLKSLGEQPVLVEVVIQQKDLAPQLERLATLPGQLQKYGRTNLALSKS